MFSCHKSVLITFNPTPVLSSQRMFLNHGETTALTLEDDLGDILWTSIPNHNKEVCNQAGHPALWLNDPPKGQRITDNNEELPSNSESKWRYQKTFRKVIRMSDNQQLINGLVEDKNSNHKKHITDDNDSKRDDNVCSYLGYYTIVSYSVCNALSMHYIKRIRWLVRNRILTKSLVLVLSEDKEESKKSNVNAYRNKSVLLSLLKSKKKYILIW